MSSISNGAIPTRRHQQQNGQPDCSSSVTTSPPTPSSSAAATTTSTSGKAGPREMSPLPQWCRFYFYGMHGLLDEVVFTALFDLLLEPTGNRHLKGCTSLTSFFMYGSCSLVVEHVFLYCIRRQYSIMRRLPIYVTILYLWELVWGLALRQLDACSWDYSHYPLNLFGLITLVYLPGWTALCLLQDRIYYFLFCLHVGDIEHKIKTKVS